MVDPAGPVVRASGTIAGRHASEGARLPGFVARLGQRVRRMVLVVVGVLMLVPIAILVDAAMGPASEAVATAAAAIVVATPLVAVAVLVWPRAGSTPVAPVSPADDPAALPGRARRWLADRRLDMPRAAQPVLDRIFAHLTALEAQFASVTPGHPVALDTRRLLNNHLGELVEHYIRVPADERAVTDAAGHSIDASFVDSLAVIEAELARTVRQMSDEDRSAFLVHDRFVESRYTMPMTAEKT